jgi:aryl-alcohol dehydrogenase-like predicted oxidoreductase
MSNKIILGTVQFGLNYGINNSLGKPSKETVFQILSYAYDNGIRYLDTAELYGNAHDLIGEYHKLNPNKKFNIVTKFPHDFEGDIEIKIKKYLDQLNVNHLHGILFHSFESYLIHKDKLIKKLYNVEQIGVSVYTNEQIEIVVNDTNISIIQLPFNLFDNINHRGELILKAKAKNKTVHTRSAFLQGLFFMNKDNDIRKELSAELEIISQIALKYSISIGSLALNYCLKQVNIDAVLIGVDSLNQLKENITYSVDNISEAYINEIDKIRIHNVELLNPSLWR